MSKRTQLQHKQLTWVKDNNLAMALHCRNHRQYKTFDDTITGKLEWLFYDTQALRRDIEKYENRTLMVNAQDYATYLTGRFYGDE